MMLSVIVPAYNCIQSIKYCVRSVRQQTIADWELILVDDGSSDGSGRLCDQFALEDTRIRVIHKENGGVSSARNAGINAALGEYITFCDSDDYLEPDYLELLLQTAKDNPDCGHIWCCFQTVSGYQKENCTPNFTADKSVLFYSLQEFMTLHERWLDTGPWNKLFRTEVVQKKNVRFPEDLSLGEDWVFNLRYIDASGNDRIAVITKPLYNYLRGNEESLDSKYREDLPEIYHRLTAECLTRLQRWGAPQEQMDKYYNSCFFMYEKVLRNTMRAPDKSRQEKVRWNSAFMKSETFQKALRQRTCYVNPFYLAAYQKGDFLIVLLLDRLYHLKNNCIHVIRKG